MFILKKNSLIAPIFSIILVSTVASKRASNYINKAFLSLPYNQEFYIQNSSAESSDTKVYFEKNNFSYIDVNENGNFKENEYSRVAIKQLEAKDQEIYRTIRDHTIRLSMPCQSGTGWILDFVIPEDGSYPTKFFIATNMHVVNNYRFNSNPYNINLPISIDDDFNAEGELIKKEKKKFFKFFSNVDEFPKQAGCNESIQKRNAEMNIYKEISVFYQLKNNFFGSIWNMFLQKPQIVETLSYLTTPAIEPKLLFTAQNFLGDRYRKDGSKVKNMPYKKDFAVLEINFRNQDSAKKITDSFYEKYYVSKDKKQAKTSWKKEGVKYFSPELMKNKSHSDLANINDFYFGGYPGNRLSKPSFEINKRFNLKTKTLTKSTLSRINWKKISNSFPLLNKHGEIIMGHINLTELNKMPISGQLAWNKEKLLGWGYGYVINNSFLTPGSSGSMVIDKDKNLYGLYSMYNNLYNQGFIEPIRSDGIIDKGKIIMPKYDLIKGIENQPNSYKSQLDKYFPNLKTYLREKDWKN